MDKEAALIRKIMDDVANGVEPLIFTGVQNPANTASVTLESIEEAMLEWASESFGAYLKEIVFRDAAEIEPWLQALGARRRTVGMGDLAFLTGVPLLVDPELQGPSPKLVKELRGCEFNPFGGER